MICKSGFQAVQVGLVVERSCLSRTRSAEHRAQSIIYYYAETLLAIPLDSRTGFDNLMRLRKLLVHYLLGFRSLQGGQGASIYFFGSMTHASQGLGWR